jgi:hypothetical protein
LAIVVTWLTSVARGTKPEMYRLLSAAVQGGVRELGPRTIWLADIADDDQVHGVIFSSASQTLSR